MKINIKLKDFLDKENLQKSLDTKLKKPVQHLAKKPGTLLPFCYEAEYFEDGSGFMSIGVAKELQAHFKKQRVKGQGKDENGKVIKIDKKKVAIGQVALDDEGNYEFFVEAGMMRKPQVKATIKSISFLKKNIGDNYTIIKGGPTDAPVEEESTVDEDGMEENVDNTDETTETPTDETMETSTDETTDETVDTDTEEEGTEAPVDDRNKRVREAKREKLSTNMPKLEGAVGVADPAKVQASIDKYKQVLQDLIKEAEADGTIDDQEQAEIDQLQSALEALEAQLQRLGDRKIKLTPKNKEKVVKNIGIAEQRIQKILEDLGV